MADKTPKNTLLGNDRHHNPDDVLRRMLNTPPKPKTKPKDKTPPAPKQ